MNLTEQTSFYCHDHTLRTLRSGSRYSHSISYRWAEVNGQTYGIEPDDPWDHAFAAVCLNKWGD